MKKPLLLASIAGSALFLVGALIIIVGFVHQAGQKPNPAADVISKANSVCSKKYGNAGNPCEIGYEDIASAITSSSQDSHYNQALANACPSPSTESNPYHVPASVLQADYNACVYGATQAFNAVNASAPSSSAAKPSTSSSSSKSSSSKSSSSKSSSSSSSKSSPAAKPAATTAAAPATTTADTSSTATTTAVQPDSSGPLNANQCQDSGGANVSGVWAGIPGVDTIIKGGCIGGNGVNPIYAFISIIITFATGILGLVMVLMIVIAGLQYVISDGSPDIVRDAKNRINHVVTGFVIFVLMWGILQVLLPANVSVFK